MKNLLLYTLQKFPICHVSPPFKEGLGVFKGAKGYLALLCFCLLLIACKPDREILPSSNPCDTYKNLTQASANTFTVRCHNQNIWRYNLPQLLDSFPTYLITQSLLFLSPYDNNDGYRHWVYLNGKFLGSVYFAIFSVKQLNLTNNLQYTVSIQHKMAWPINLLCNPNGIKQTDSIGTKPYFKVTHRLRDFYTYGKYRMVYDTLGAPFNQDSTIIQFYATNDNKNSPLIRVTPTDPNIFYHPFLSVKGLLTRDFIRTSPDTIFRRVPSDTATYFPNSIPMRPFDMQSPEFAITNTYIVYESTVSVQYPFIYLYLFVHPDKTVTLIYKNYKTVYRLRGRKINDNITTYNDNKNNNPK